MDRMAHLNQPVGLAKRSYAYSGNMLEFRFHSLAKLTADGVGAILRFHISREINEHPVVLAVNCDLTALQYFQHFAIRRNCLQLSMDYAEHLKYVSTKTYRYWLRIVTASPQRELIFIRT